MRGALRLWLRGSRLVFHLLLGLIAAAAVTLDFSGRLRPEPIARRWSRRLLRILGLRMILRGTPVAGARITVANHVSWLDISLISACEDTRFIAKSEIRDWPIAGWLANAAGTFYIRRGKGGARPLVERLVPHLAGGGAVVLFPEGTTTDGQTLRPFHARLFAAAVDAGAPVQPVALRYAPTADGRRLAAFVGDDDLVSHLLRLLRAPGLQVEIIYCAPIEPAGVDRDTLARRAETAIRRALDLPVAADIPLAA